MAGSTIQAFLIMSTYFRVLIFGMCVTMAPCAQFSGPLYRHRAFGMIGWNGAMAGLAGHPISLIGSRRGIIACRMADETGTRLALLRPFCQKDRITAGLSVRTVLPCRLEFSMTSSTVRRGLHGRHCPRLCAANDQCGSRSQ